ncbi:MAG: hypothetical protein RBU30_26325 [Polyangia bacterium]|nr:hypothetical protein [Polyangia bacterium]
MNTLKLAGELIRTGMPFRRLLHFGGGHALEAGDATSALVVHDLRERKHRMIARTGLAPGERVRSAVLLPDGRVLAVTVAGRKTPTARLRFLSAQDKHLGEPSLTWRYEVKRFQGPNFARAGMAGRYLYVYCGAMAEGACEQIKLDGGFPYKQAIDRDRSVSLAVSSTGDQIAVYVFGTLYIYKASGTGLSLERRWPDIFYIDKDSHFRDPSLQWDPSSRWLAVTSGVRLNLLVDTRSGRVEPLIDYSIPMHHRSYYRPGRRGATFLGGPNPRLMMGDLRGDLLLFDPSSKGRSQHKLPEAGFYDHRLSEPDIIAYLHRCGDSLVAWRDGAVYVLDAQTMQLRARMGTYAALGLSRLLSSLKMP